MYTGNSSYPTVDRRSALYAVRCVVIQITHRRSPTRKEPLSIDNNSAASQGWHGDCLLYLARSFGNTSEVTRWFIGDYYTFYYKVPHMWCNVVTLYYDNTVFLLYCKCIDLIVSVFELLLRRYDWLYSVHVTRRLEVNGCALDLFLEIPRKSYRTD